MVNTTSWAIFLAIVGAGYWYYTHQNASGGRARGRSITRPNTATGKGDTKWMETAETKAKAASKAAKKKTPKSVKKTVQDATEKVTEVAEKASTYVSGGSTAGADADDDSSSVGSGFKLPSGKDVSDMLEKTAAAPSVMKILPSSQPARPAKPQQQKSETPQESKKQRQNRKKAEEAKAQREAAEKERKVLAEQQRRTAREARGEPAKNGLQSTKAPATSAWAADRPAAEVVAAATPAKNNELLDTFEPAAAKADTKSSKGNGQDWTNGMTEDEQVRMAMEDSAWETVPKGKKQKKTKAAEDTSADEKVQVISRESAPAQASVPQVEKKAKVENRIPEPKYESLESIPDIKHPQDSEWGVV